MTRDEAAAPTGEPPAGADDGFWLDRALDALRLLADGAPDAALARASADPDHPDAPRAPLFLALGALRARLADPDAFDPRGGLAGLLPFSASSRRADGPSTAATANPPAPGAVGAGTATPATDGAAIHASPNAPAPERPRTLADLAGECAVAALAAQRPDAIDPAAIPLLDAHARGDLDPPASQAIDALVDGWLGAVADSPGRTEREVRRWSAALASLCPPAPDELFPALRAAVGDGWPAVASALRGAALAGAVEGWCATLAPRADADEPSPLAAVDAALAALVAAPDAEEGALAARVRDARGRLRPPAPGHATADPDAPAPLDPADDSAPPRDPARAADAPPSDPAHGIADAIADEPATPRPAPDPALNPAPFGQWLATIAMAPARVGASAPLRRWAARRARASILGAFDLLADDARADPAPDVAVALGGWRGRLADPAAALVESLHAAVRRRGAASELALRPPRGTGALLAAGLLMLAVAPLAGSWTLALAGLGAIAAWLSARRAHARRRARAHAAAGMAQARAVATLHAVVEEWAAVRRDHADGVARLPDARDRLRRTLSR